LSLFQLNFGSGRQSAAAASKFAQNVPQIEAFSHPSLAQSLSAGVGLWKTIQSILASAGLKSQLVICASQQQRCLEKFQISRLAGLSNSQLQFSSAK